MARFLTILALSFVLAPPVHAQVTVQLQLAKRNFLAGEPVNATVTLTNLSGRELIFQSTDGAPWLDFIVTSGRGVPLTPGTIPASGAVKLPAGQSLARTINLANIYPMRELGNYSLYAIARLPGQTRDGFQSNRSTFTVVTALPYWSQVVGVPNSSRNNEYRLIQFSAERKSQLYVQVAASPSGSLVATHHLGEVLMLRKPSVTIDSALNMHVLYLITPSVWGHARITPDGRFLGRDLYRPPAAGNPSLVQMPDGSVRTENAFLYNPEQEAAERERTRNASDRPDFIYE